MPTYSYECKKCGHEFDIIQRISDDALTDCPECKAKNELKKVIKPSESGGFALKGKGWFKTGGY